MSDFVVIHKFENQVDYLRTGYFYKLVVLRSDKDRLLNLLLIKKEIEEGEAIVEQNK